MKNRYIGIMALALLGVFVVLPVLGTAMGIITLPWLKLNTQVQTNQDIIKKTYNADNVIYNYEWFKNRAEEIKATETKIGNAKQAIGSFESSAGARTGWTFEDKTEHARLSAVYLGLQNHYEDIVAEYNARAQQANRNIFQDDLPLFFSLNPF